MSNDDSDERTGWSRRAFLGGTTGGAAALGLLSTKRSAQAQTPPRVVSGAVPLTLKVNGTARNVTVEPRTTLARALRDSLGLTGTKIGCDRAACGACTVHLDGQPQLSCTTLAIEVGDREVTTIEGLAPNGKLHVLQQAFVDNDAMQCGFCTPGMVMSCAALLAKTPRPDRSQIRAACSGNLCRCGTYPKVFDAVMVASGQKPEGWPLEVRNTKETAAPPPGTAWVGTDATSAKCVA